MYENIMGSPEQNFLNECPLWKENFKKGSIWPQIPYILKVVTTVLCIIMVHRKPGVIIIYGTLLSKWNLVDRWNRRRWEESGAFSNSVNYNRGQKAMWRRFVSTKPCTSWCSEISYNNSNCYTSFIHRPSRVSIIPHAGRDAKDDNVLGFPFQ